MLYKLSFGVLILKRKSLLIWRVNVTEKLMVHILGTVYLSHDERYVSLIIVCWNVVCRSHFVLKGEHKNQIESDHTNET